MTAEVSQGARTALPAADDAVALARHRRMLRLALGTTFSFVTAEMLDWELSFVITALLIQFLAAPGRAPGLRQGFAIILGLGLATSAAATLSALLVPMPALLAVVLGLVLFLAFTLQGSKRNPALGRLILVAFSLLPVVAVQAPDLVPAVALYLVRSGAVAVLWLWLLHALLPDPEAAAPQVPAHGGVATPPSEVVRTALADTAVLLPVLLVAMTLEVSAALVIILTVTAILSQHNVAGGGRVALGLLLGNLLGGITAVVAYQLLSAVPTLGFVTALLLLVSLVYARLITGTASLAPLFVTGLVTFIIVFGMAVAPVLDEPGATLAIRVRNLAIACIYVFAALGLIRRIGRSPVKVEAAGAGQD